MKPNIIYILADDMGYGDLGANNPDSKIPTPNLDRLCGEGMRFTDAHAGAAVCTPSRYNVLTGRYPWRSRLKNGIVWEWDDSLIEPDRRTVAHLLKDQGYFTACLGKWHLGWEWPTKSGRHPNEVVDFGDMARERRHELEGDIDYAGRIGGGPVDRGFDHYFGVDVPNFPPYTWFEDAHLTDAPTVPKPDEMYGHAGLMKPGWSLEAMIPEFTRRAVELIESKAGSDQPYFLYFPLTSPHSPVVPNDRFKGMSGAGNYGDFVCEVDWVVGQVMEALDRTGTAENTLLIFTSDNGPETRTPDDIGVYERIREHGHYSMDGLRGVKLDSWEGGHREPFVARWPKVVPAGTVCDQLIGLGDLMATCAEIVDVEFGPDEGEDSVSILPLLRGETDRPVRDCAVYQNMRGELSMRRGAWVFLDHPHGGCKEEPDWYRAERGYEPHDQPGELYHLRDDLIQRRNLYAEHPDKVAELKARLDEIIAAEASRLHARHRDVESAEEA
jgi:arylsulfatase A-like enzyme